MYRYESEYDRYRVNFIWDWDNTPVQEYQALDVLGSVQNSLRRIDRRYYLSKDVVAVGSASRTFIRHNHRELKKQGYSLLYTPRKRYTCHICGYVADEFLPIVAHERCKEIADRMIVQTMISNVVRDRRLLNVCLSSGDSDFGLPLGFLRGGGYKIFLMVNQTSRLDYVNHGGDYIFSWEDVIRNGGADPTYGPFGRWYPRYD